MLSSSILQRTSLQDTILSHATGIRRRSLIVYCMCGIQSIGCTTEEAVAAGDLVQQMLIFDPKCRKGVVQVYTWFASLVK